MQKLGFKDAEEAETKLPTLVGSWKKQEFQKNICVIDYAKGFDCMEPTLKREEYKTILPVYKRQILQKEFSCHKPLP